MQLNVLASRRGLALIILTAAILGGMLGFGTFYAYAQWKHSNYCHTVADNIATIDQGQPESVVAIDQRTYFNQCTGIQDL